jgi:hypothetical protein
MNHTSYSTDNVIIKLIVCILIKSFLSRFLLVRVFTIYLYINKKVVSTDKGNTLYYGFNDKFLELWNVVLGK